MLAVAFDLKTFFTVIAKDPVDVVAADVFEFLAHQRGDRTVIRMSDRESGLSARTIARRLSSVSGFYAYLVARGDTPIGTVALGANRTILQHRAATVRCANRSGRPISVGANRLFRTPRQTGRRRAGSMQQCRWTNVEWFEHEQAVIRDLRAHNVFDRLIDGEGTVASIADDIMKLVEDLRQS